MLLLRIKNFDLRSIYWRALRRLQLMRGAYRFYMSEMRAQTQLHYLHCFGQMPEPPTPEENRVYRALWVCAIVMTAAVIAVDCVGEDKVRNRIDDVVAAFRDLPNRRIAQEHTPRVEATPRLEEIPPAERHAPPVLSGPDGRREFGRLKFPNI